LWIVRDEDRVKMDNILYKQVVGSLMYLTPTRPDLMFVVSLIRRYMSSPTELYMQTTKRVLKSLRGIINFGMFYKKKRRNWDLLGLHRHWLCKRPRWQEKHFRLCFLIKFKGSIVVIKKIVNCNSIYIGKIHCCSLLRI